MRVKFYVPVCTCESKITGIFKFHCFVESDCHFVYSNYVGIHAPEV